MHHHHTASILTLVVLLLTACGPTPQQSAYERAEAMEVAYTTETAPAIIAEYRKVVALDPGTKWAKRAETRIAAVEARVKADEHHKEVFQEHGID